MRYMTSLNSQWFKKYKPSKKKNRKEIRQRTSLLRRIYFLFSQLWRIVFLEPLGVQRSYVPHFKDLISDNLEPTAQGRGRTFTLCYTIIKVLGRVTRLKNFGFWLAFVLRDRDLAMLSGVNFTLKNKYLTTYFYFLTQIPVGTSKLPIWDDLGPTVDLL